MATPYAHGTSDVNSPSIPVREGGDGGWSDFVGANGKGWLPPNGSGEFSVFIVARMLGIGESTLRRLIAKHEIPYRLIGRQRFITAEAIRSACPLETGEGRDEEE